MIKVSIVTVVYNREATISRAIESVVRQTYKNIEYIIIDGLSTDGTLDIINQYSSSVSKIISEKDWGIYDALNKGIGLSTGDIIGFLHSDDFLANNEVINKMVDGFGKDCDLIFGDLSFFNAHNATKVVRDYKSGFFQPWMMRFALQPAHPTVYARRSVYDELGLFDTRYAISADFDWLLRALYLEKRRSCYLPMEMVRMQNGGASTGGIRAIIKHNKEDLLILKSHGVYSNWFFVLLKYGYKIFQLRF